MYRFADIKKVRGGGYKLPGSIEITSCLSVSKALDKLGLYGTSTNAAPGQASKGTKAHNHINRGKKTGSDLYYDTVQAHYANFQFHSQEIFVWTPYLITPKVECLVGVFDALLVSDTSIILVDWKTTGQDVGLSQKTLNRALAQVCLYNYMLKECYCINTTKVCVVPLHERNDLQPYEIPTSTSLNIAHQLIDNLIAGEKCGGLQIFDYVV